DKLKHALDTQEHGDGQNHRPGRNQAELVFVRLLRPVLLVAPGHRHCVTSRPERLRARRNSTVASNAIETGKNQRSRTRNWSLESGTPIGVTSYPSSSVQTA